LRFDFGAWPGGKGRLRELGGYVNNTAWSWTARRPHLLSAATAGGLDADPTDRSRTWSASGHGSASDPSTIYFDPSPSSGPLPRTVGNGLTAEKGDLIMGRPGGMGELTVQGIRGAEIHPNPTRPPGGLRRGDTTSPRSPETASF